MLVGHYFVWHVRVLSRLAEVKHDINNGNPRNRFVNVEFTHARPKVSRTLCMQWPKHDTTQNKNIPTLVAKNK